MPFTFITKDRTRVITVCGDVKIHIIGMSALEKEAMLVRFDEAERKPGCWKKFVEIITGVIVKIEGYDQSAEELLNKIDYGELREVVFAVIDHCGLSKEERKNSSSSSAQHTPESTGSAEKNADPDSEPVSSTPTTMNE